MSSIDSETPVDEPTIEESSGQQTEEIEALPQEEDADGEQESQEPHLVEGETAPESEPDEANPEETNPETNDDVEPEKEEEEDKSIYQHAEVLSNEAEQRLDDATSTMTLLSGVKDPSVVTVEVEVATGQESQTILEEEDGTDRSKPATSAMLKKQRESEGWLSTLDVEAILSRKSEVNTYLHACKELCIVPTSFFAKRIATREIILAHHGRRLLNNAKVSVQRVRKRFHKS
jgi:hypothetical protein